MSSGEGLIRSALEWEKGLDAVLHSWVDTSLAHECRGAVKRVSEFLTDLIERPEATANE
jgi:hypothetical protein